MDRPKGTAPSPRPTKFTKRPLQSSPFPCKASCNTFPFPLPLILQSWDAACSQHPLPSAVSGCLMLQWQVPS